MAELDETRRFRGTVTVTVPLAPERAMPLFTARGERLWVPGWEAGFPAGEPLGDEVEGTVFVTAADDRTTIWVVAARSDRSVRYVRTTPGIWAGSVDVRQRGADAGERTAVDVTYDLTALSDEGARELTRFAAAFEREIGQWEDLIREALVAGRLD